MSYIYIGHCFAMYVDMGEWQNSFHALITYALFVLNSPSESFLQGRI